MSYNPNQNFSQPRAGGGGGYQPLYQQQAPSAQQQQQNYGQARQNFAPEVSPRNGFHPTPQQQPPAGGHYGRGPGPARGAAPAVDEWGGYSQQEPPGQYNAHSRYPGGAAGSQQSAYAGGRGPPSAYSSATLAQSTASAAGNNSMSNIKLTLAQTISNLAAAAASASSGAGAGSNAGGAPGIQDYGRSGSYNPSYAAQQHYSPPMTGVAAGAGTNRFNSQPPQQQLGGGNNSTTSHALRHAPLAANTNSSAVSASPSLRGQSAMPVDVRYQAHSAAPVQSGRYSSAPEVAGGRPSAGGNVPSNGGFYNRRPENTAHPQAHSRGDGMQQNREDIIYDSRADPSFTHQQTPYVHPAANGPGRAGYAPPLDTQSNQSLPFQQSPHASMQQNTLHGAAAALPLREVYGSNDYAAPRNLPQPVVPAIRATKWSQCLMDPLDVNDGLLENSLRRGPKGSQSQSTAIPSGNKRGAVAREGREVSYYGSAATNAPAVSTSTTTKRLRRDRSASPAPARRRSRSRSLSGSRSHSLTRHDAATTLVRSAAPSEPTRRGSGLPFGARPSRPLSYAATPVAQLISDFHLPAVDLNITKVSVLDLYTKFPKLYIPNDFVHARVDTKALNTALDSDIFTDIVDSVPILVESNNPTLLPNDNPARCSMASSDVLDIPKFTCSDYPVTPSTSVAKFSESKKSVKFQVRILVCCGMRNPEDERIDHNLPQKLRVLCGRRKGNYQLLGCPWSRELDADSDTDPNETPLTNPTCLVRTAQRALLAQALLQIPVRSERVRVNSSDTGADMIRYSAEGLVPLCEVQYHRPAEEVKGKTFPEQVELTTIFLYTIQPSILSGLSEYDLKLQLRIMNRRVQGICPGPLLNCKLDEWARRLEEAEKHINLQESITLDADESAKVEIEHDVDTPNLSDSIEVAEKPCADEVKDTRDGSNGDDAVAAVLAAAVAARSASHEDTDKPIELEDPTPATAITTSAALSKLRKPFSEPSEPSLFLCPMPLSSEVAQDASKKQDALALRLIPLHSLLTYSQDDRSERLFETSLAAELLRSMLCVGYANTITDFVLAEHPELNSFCDIRVQEATTSLRLMIAALKEKTATKPSNNKLSNRPNGSTPDVTIAKAANGEPQQNGKDDQNTHEKESEDEEGEEVEVEFHVDYTPSADTAQDSTDCVEMEDAAGAAAPSPVTNENVVASESKEEDSEPTNQCTAEGSVDVSPLCEEDARKWRRRFVSAARWFDTTEEMCLHYEHLKMILHSSTRNLSRADVEEALERICKNDLLRYETFV